MRGAIPPLPNKPSWCGAQLKNGFIKMQKCTEIGQNSYLKMRHFCNDT